MSTQNIAKLYKQFTSVLKVTGGQVKKLDNDSYVIEAISKVTDCENRRKSIIKKLYNFKFDGIRLPLSVNCCQYSSVGFQTTELAEATTNNGRYTARLVQSQKPELDGEKNQVLEIWEVAYDSGVSLLKSIDISKLETHGRIVLDEPFFAFEWDSCGNQNKLLYTCLTKPKKHSSPFSESLKNSDKPALDVVYQEFDKKDDWGETMDSIEHTVVGILSVEDNFSITMIDMPGYSLANSYWLKGGKIISEAYQEEPRLGIVYCNNRPSIITIHDSITGLFLSDLRSKENSFNQLRVNNAGDQFLVAENSTFGPHFQPSKLKLYNADLGLISKLTKEPIFLQCLPKQCFSSDDRCILFAFSKDLRSQLTLLSLDNLSQIHFDTPCPTISAITLKYDLMLICGSSINQPPSLYLGSLECPNWIPVEKPKDLDFIDYEVIQDIQTSDKNDQTSAIMLKQKSNESITNRLTVFAIHGGPCTCYQNSYYEFYAFLVKSGISVILTNYRGSAGVNEDYLRKLSGASGLMDVEDCSETIRYFVRRKLVDPNQLAVLGGSHGGFLTGHLCAKGEFQFTSAVMINPVLDLASSFFTTDIPDWVMEVGLGKKYDPKWMPEHGDLERMFNQSPLFKATNSKVPTLMLLGSKDLRVKMYQGLRWIEHLKSQGVDTCCKVYPDTHQLLNHSPEYHVTATAWLLDHSIEKSSTSKF